MEDCNLLAADCVAISCCCQCLILQLLIFVFLKMPRRLLHRTRDYASKKLARMRRRKKVETELKESAKLGEMLAQMYHDDESMCIDIGGGIEEFKKSRFVEDHDGMEEIERVLDEYCANGEFGFGSFWRKEVSKMGSPRPSLPLSSSPRSCWRSVAYSCPSHSSSSAMRSMSVAAKKKKKRRKEEGLKVVEFELVEMVRSLSSCGSFKSIDRLLDCDRRNMTLT
ncbi:hypothetical protein LINGRAHAP2_LOCUS37327 [Linum grandiflorum]